MRNLLDKQLSARAMAAVVGGAVVLVLLAVLLIPGGSKPHHPTTTAITAPVTGITSQPDAASTPAWQDRMTDGVSVGPRTVRSAATTFIHAYSLVLRGVTPASTLHPASAAVIEQYKHWHGALPTYDPWTTVKLRITRAKHGYEAIAAMQADGTAFPVVLDLARRHGRWVITAVPSATRTY